MPTLVNRKILSATLKAEAVRIRYLRDCALRHRTIYRESAAEALRLRAEATSSYHELERAKTLEARERVHTDLFWRFRRSSECPSERARCANLALGYLRGTPYHRIEASTHSSYGTMNRIMREVATKAGAPVEDILRWWLYKPAEAVAPASEEHCAA